jgi:hypothetical protein
VLLWWGTALVSLLGWGGPSHALLSEGGVTAPALAASLILGGVLLDVTVGACLLLWPRPRVYVAALVAVGLLSVLATVMTPSAWLHPYGPLLKNLPLMASLVWAWQVDGDVDGGAR